jgi:uncharacterized protein
LSSPTRRRGRPQALTESELDELDDFLLSAAVPESCMDLEQLDGFLTAIACSPEDIPVREYAPLIWHDCAPPDLRTQDPPPPPDVPERILELIARHLLAIRAQLESGWPYEPVLFEYADESGPGEAPRILANDWAIGFVRALELRRHAWQPVIEDDEAGLGVALVIGIAYEHDRNIVDEPITPQQRAAMLEALPESILRIYDYWRARRAGVAQAGAGTRPRPTGPCPCGSGRRYRDCCGRADILH